MVAIWRRRLTGYAFALGTAALVSVFIGFVLGRGNIANISMLYLLAVMATAVVYGRGPAVFASVLAFLTFDWFFVEPLHQFTVSDPEEWVSLLLFLLTATVTGQLAAGQRQRAREAQQREREAVVLYDVVRLLGEGHVDTALAAVAERLRSELELEGLAIELWRPGGEARRFTAGKTARIARGTRPSRRLEQGAARRRAHRPMASTRHLADGCASFSRRGRPALDRL